MKSVRWASVSLLLALVEKETRWDYADPKHGRTLVHLDRFIDAAKAFEPSPDGIPQLGPVLAPRLTKIGEERVFVMHWRGEDPAEAIVELPPGDERLEAVFPVMRELRTELSDDQLAERYAASLPAGEDAYLDYSLQGGP